MMMHALLSWHLFLHWLSKSSRTWMSSHSPTSFNLCHAHPVLDPAFNNQRFNPSLKLAPPRMCTQMLGLCHCRLMQALMEKRHRIWQLQPAVGSIAFPAPHHMGVRVSIYSNLTTSLPLLVVSYLIQLPPLVPH